jgi:hypothetical protein
LKTRTPVILLFGLVSLSILSKCTGRDTPAAPNLPKIVEPNVSGPVGTVDANTHLGEDVNQVKEANEAPSRSRTAEPDEQEPNTPAYPDVNEPDTVAESAGDTFNKEFAPIFSEYVNEQGMVDYAKLRRHRLEMRALLAQLAILDPQEYESWTREEKIAFWINTFNVKMLNIIIENYPIESRRFDRLWWPPNSIRHIQPRAKVGTPKWNSYKFIVMDEEFTLYEIENRFFRKEFADPRIFLALCFASLDSPPLRNEPYYGKDLDRQLDVQAKRFLSTTSGIRIDRQNQKVYLSVFFEPEWPWYGRQFLAKYRTDKKFKSQSQAIAAVLNFITNYLDKHDIAYLETGNYSVSFKAYDWRVNEQ